ncbi:hypothetical protein K2173_016086 [Erythroxylum novogranatense]|uniref:Hydroxyproline-rich glycoprotein family protein n=1 Tax=Erythroxylum novogranatense TaxID=1862640 RepID=A0AAV8SFU2_9ROSI|nr:hypothetical protein K2173_016086 [Erythroxylum novogranatense]
MPRRGSPSPLRNLPLLIIILPVVALLLLFFALPSLLSATNHKIRSSTVKNGWDSVNVCLVLFAILCGIFARRNDDDSTTNDYDRSTQNVPRVAHDSKPQQYSVSNQWFDQFSEKIFANPSFNTPVTSTGRLKRNSSSYPDLKIESLWENSDDHDHFRFFDDCEINKYRSSSEYSHHGTPRSIFEEPSVKEIQVDTFILRSSTQQKSPAPPTPPPPPPPPRTDHKQSHTYRTVSRKEMVDKEREHHHDFKKINSPSPRILTSPPPPPPQIKSPISSEHKYRKSWERKRSNTTREIKMVLASVLHNQKKRKKKHKAKSSSAENPIHPSSQSPSFLEPSLSSEKPLPAPPVPPPPPPPPPSFFHSLFRKGNKSKRIHSFSPPPPPPPPPPTSKRWSKRQGQVPPPPAGPPPPSKSSKHRNSAATGRPPLPTKGTNLYDENVNSGGQSPLIPMPPPPPPPPFKVPGFRFVLKGDFVKLSSSAHSSRCGSPEPEEIDKEPSSEKVNTINDSSRTVFCPSPDVNIKADSFIARLRDGWRLENINSSKEKRSLDQDPEPVP